MKCYNCGCELTTENRTREHIPAKNLFNGYSEEYKTNRIVVPACFICNNQYSQIDQEIRDVIGIINHDNEQQKEVTRQAVKSIMRKSNWVERIEFGQTVNKNISVTFNYSHLRELHLKNFKGIFYHEYKFNLPKNFELEIIAEGDEEFAKLVAIKNMIQKYLETKNWNVSGHADVFKYKLAMLDFSQPSESFDFSETTDIQKCNLIIGELIYHDVINPIIFAADKTYLNSIKPK
ncbi:hypothetical protein [uncultured Chryseobacterium sp.]|uniref:hypothetical protein n=1 Tax=uncultured Chryseobacterium sp. TaxID=259322 RepID=UPI0025E20157|nr:hypothetical protein [uncultured Chryseobacterium sp.]